MPGSLGRPGGRRVSFAGGRVSFAEGWVSFAGEPPGERPRLGPEPVFRRLRRHLNSLTRVVTGGAFGSWMVVSRLNMKPG
jgi:hypothetical protein